MTSMFISLVLEHGFIPMAKNPNKENKEYFLSSLEQNRVTEEELSQYILDILTDNTASYFGKYHKKDLFINQYVLDFLQNHNKLESLYNYAPGNEKQNRCYFMEFFMATIETSAFKHIINNWAIFSDPENCLSIIEGMLFNNKQSQIKNNIDNNILSYIQHQTEEKKDQLLNTANVFLIDANLKNIREDVLLLLNDDMFKNKYKDELFEFYTTGRFTNQKQINIDHNELDFFVKVVFDQMSNNELRTFIKEIQKTKNNYLDRTPFKKLVTYFLERDLLDLFDVKNDKVLLNNIGYLTFNNFKESLNILKSSGHNKKMEDLFIETFLQYNNTKQILPLLSYMKENNITFNIEKHKEKIISAFSDYIYTSKLNKIKKQANVLNELIPFKDNSILYMNNIFLIIKKELKKDNYESIETKLNDIEEKYKSFNFNLDFSLIDKESLKKISETPLGIFIEKNILNSKIKDNNLEIDFHKKRL